MADHGTATAFPATVAGTTTYPAQNYTHTFPLVHVFGGVTAIIFGPW